MSEWSFLSMTRERRTFPSYGKQTSRKSAGVLSAPSYIPLLWWAIFRPKDLVLDRFAQEAAEDGEPIPAPIVE